MGPNPQFPVDLVSFAEEILNGKLHFCPVLKKLKPVSQVYAKRLYSNQNDRKNDSTHLMSQKALQLSVTAIIMSVNCKFCSNF